MHVPVGFAAKLWSFLSFLPFFFLLLILGVLKAAIVCPLVVAIIVVGNSSVIIGLWPAHFVWSYYCVVRTKNVGLVLKIVVLLLLPVPLILWPIMGIVGTKSSLIVGMYYSKFLHKDGCWSTLGGSCTVVQDLTDFCFHSYFSFMDELIEIMPLEEKPTEIKLSKLPSCFLVSLIGVPVDVLLITAVALWKSPYMLFRGWKRLLEDLIGREGPFLETVCVPFAGLAILLWPMAVVGAVIGAIFSSVFIGLYGGVIVHQEDSFLMGLAYIISVVSLFDEYVNDLLYLREGSCLPRPRYRRNRSPDLERKNSRDNENYSWKNRREGSFNSKLFSDPSRTWKWKVNQYKPMQVWEWLFKSCEVNGRIMLRDGLINVKDIEEYLLKGHSKILSIKLPTWTILQCLLSSAKSNSSGFIIYDDVELTSIDGPRDKVLEWFIGPLLIIKEQIKKLQVTESEELCLRKLVFSCKNDRPEDWDEVGFPSSDPLRRAQLQAIIRRLQGIVASMSRIPTFPRHLRNLVKVLYIEAIQASASGNRFGGKFKSPFSGLSLSRSGDQRKYIDGTFKDSEDKGNENTVDIV
ncbi:uncharacterized membrane protein At3g27390 [Carica papaya]|uniref:uncharacterized membrane protein At3g27390 n=1 Tax=Carica papaya TaxID=3649 RepID=UPI000B8D135C|nr:uncharacterized membrane protein At3g27390 [Carica papaya]